MCSVAVFAQEASFCFVHHQLIFSSEKAEWSWMRVQRKFCNALAKGNPSTRLRAMSHSFSFQQRFQQHFDRSCESCYGCLSSLWAPLKLQTTSDFLSEHSVSLHIRSIVYLSMMSCYRVTRDSVGCVLAFGWCHGHDDHVFHPLSGRIVST